MRTRWHLRQMLVIVALFALACGALSPFLRPTSQPTVTVQLSNESSGALSDIRLTYKGGTTRFASLSAGAGVTLGITPTGDSDLVVTYQDQAGQTKAVRTGAQFMKKRRQHPISVFIQIHEKAVRIWDPATA